MDTDEFLEAMMQPEAGDEMAFRIERATPDDGRTFSQEAIDGLADNVKAFTMARTFARWKATGKAPTSMTARLRIDWDDDSDLEEGGPWWSVGDQGVTTLDGSHRLQGIRDLTQ